MRRTRVRLLFAAPAAVCFIALTPEGAVGASGVAGVAGVAGAGAESLTLVADRDNTLIEHTTGNVSGGLMPFFFAGDTSQGPSDNTRRALMHFNVSSIPRGSFILAVNLTLSMSKSAIAGPNEFTLHRVTADWGEGTSRGDGGTGGFSTPQSATWIHRFFPAVLWSNAGGDFDAAPSAAVLVSGVGSYTWNAPDMIDDVQRWIDEPNTNFGWLLKAPEGAIISAKRFESREAIIAADRPTLVITYLAAVPCTSDINSDGEVNVSDLLAVISAWGPCTAGCSAVLPCPADINADCTVNVTDLLAVIGAWGACP